ncbi:hypothetical protein BEWA_030210 [Theileria equi strain WA]|uniref:Uncharacterized protein n=1 Tax=Theileria equi strain WA TaxID=1537102 RepID=L0AY26_THEEQ|nr:hypothetical protein BEWA_030210 [Theileria equi strain WA]AFZ80168.1 hypothetical protein BEWA_030210 [Theileria equi strain WA]|eukprot:XP_004829834.1 hypothetical protein BEWA_030210 [Theileria equi strain WA]
MWKSSKGNYPDDGDKGRASHSSKYSSSRGHENSHYERDNHGRHSNRMSNTNKRDGYSSYRGSSRDRHRYSHNRRHNEPSGGPNRQYNRSRPHDYSDSHSDHSQDDGRHGRKRHYHDNSNPRVHNKSQHIDQGRRSTRHDSPYRGRPKRSPSPRTPRSASPRRRRYSPPAPPFEPPTARAGDGSSRSEAAQAPVMEFSKFAEAKRPDTKDAGPDPRLSEPLYGTRIVTKFDVVAFPKNANIDTSLDSPPFTLDMDWDSIYTICSFLQTPLERINGYLTFSRPKVEQEWWLKGTLSLLLIGIPRNWGAMDSLSHIVNSYTRISNQDDLPEQDFTDVLWSPKSNKADVKKACTRIGITKFILLFGESGLAVNDVPANYPRITDPDTQRRIIQNEQPEGMALVVFETEEMALKFWSTLAGTPIKAYPSSIRVCPDPSGWRIYSEALSLFFQNEHLVANTVAQQPKDENSLDLLSVLTTARVNLSPDHTSPANKNDDKNSAQKLQARLTFVCSYISNQEDANTVAKVLSKHGIKCMYHKPSKIMSLQFPDDKTLQSISFCHKTFTTPSGSRAQCCFIKCDGKAIPIIKRASVEHISNSIDRRKNTVAPKPSKFKPPEIGIINIDEL